jgi:A/G-specific adenine glycosylase
MDVATVVALRRGRLLLVAQPGGNALALPGGKLEPGESAAAAALRELREETGIALTADRLCDLGLRIEVPGGPSLTPFAVVDPPRPGAPGELPARWIDIERLGSVPTVAGVARSVHRALAHVAASQPVPERLFAWWESQDGELPWRRTRDPYAVLVCEVMSQQTQIERVRVYWERWIARWPTAAALAAAPLADVLRAWQGLGYPRRARDLHACARRIASEGWPDPERLTELPGVGRYTAAARRQRASRAGATVPGGSRGQRGSVAALRCADGRRSLALSRTAALRRLPAARRLPRRAGGRRLGPGRTPPAPGRLCRLDARAPRGAAARRARRRAAAGGGGSAGRRVAAGRRADRGARRVSRCPVGIVVSWEVVDARADRQQPDAADRAHPADGARRRPWRRDDRRAAGGQ